MVYFISTIFTYSPLECTQYDELCKCYMILWHLHSRTQTITAIQTHKRAHINTHKHTQQPITQIKTDAKHANTYLTLKLTHTYICIAHTCIHQQTHKQQHTQTQIQTNIEPTRRRRRLNHPMKLREDVND